MTSKKINTSVLSIFFIQIIEGIFIKEELDLSNYKAPIYDFKEVLEDPEVSEEFRLAFQSTLACLILHPTALELNKVFCEGTGVYLASDSRIHQLLLLAWTIIYPGVDYEKYGCDDFEVTSEAIEF